MCHVDFLAMVLLLNFALSMLHGLLETFYLKTENKCDDRVYAILGYILTCLEWFMAARTGRIRK